MTCFQLNQVLFILVEYHLLQMIALVSWAALGIAVWLMFSDKAMMKIPRFLRRGRQHTIAIFCFISGSSQYMAFSSLVHIKVPKKYISVQSETSK